jgi:hypothetical protein
MVPGLFYRGFPLPIFGDKPWEDADPFYLTIGYNRLSALRIRAEKRKFNA